MAVTIAETGGHVTETALKTPLSPPVTMRRNDRSHSPKYAFVEIEALVIGFVEGGRGRGLHVVGGGKRQAPVARVLNKKWLQRLCCKRRQLLFI